MIDGRFLAPLLVALLVWLVRDLWPRPSAYTMSRLNAPPQHFRRLQKWGERIDAERIRARIDTRRDALARERAR